MTEELRKKHLQQLDDAWQALKEVMDEATEMSVASAISDGVDSDDQPPLACWLRAGVRGRDGDVEPVSEDLVTSSFQFLLGLAAVFAEEVSGDQSF